MAPRLHPLLENQPYDMKAKGGHCCPLLWNVGKPISDAKAMFPNQREPLPITHRVLSAFATDPPVPHIQISCGIFPDPWPIDVRNKQGVTVQDILESVFACLSSRYPGPDENFNALCAKQQRRILDVFQARVGTSPDPHQTWEAGMTRVDCLLHHTVFGGLSLLPLPKSGRKSTVVCILSLRRPNSFQVWDVR
ncbi:hypothetical protein VNI00_006606 [Paramarasmius palmivorus]|uniref:DUF6699 domain-containing protein n=1 Tax=Paramarasmius palmivorus TaxID=297713 RepID=A0AAW0D8D1_9AGAR